MVAMFGVYALLLVAWGLYSQRQAALAGEDIESAAAVDVAPAPTITVTRIERGEAARRHVGAPAGV